jgi:peptidoglycan hydrolase FlgJ
MQDSSIGGLIQAPAEMLIGSENTLEGKLQSLTKASGEKQKGELKKAAQEFEAVFVSYLLKAMRETIEDSGLMEEGLGKSTYTEMFDQELSVSMAKHGVLGISELLYRNLSAKDSSQGKNNPVPAPDGKQVSEPATPVPAKRSEEKTSDQEISDVHLPVQAPISSQFGARVDPFTHKIGMHKGVDLAAPEGTKVLAALPGTVVSAGCENGYGNTILVQHSGGVQTRYAHLGQMNVKAGEVVSSDQILGTVGDTGRSTGFHLHFEIIRMGRAVDPINGVQPRTAILQNRIPVSKTQGL